MGKLGREARRFVDFLPAAGMRHWQLCPLGPTGYGDSPYQCFSAFAGNPYLVDLHPLVAFGLLQDEDLKPLQLLPEDHVDYGSHYQRFWEVLDKACVAFAGQHAGLPGYGDFDAFCRAESHWLDAYAAFTACKAHFGGKPWFEWPKEVRTCQAFMASALRKKLAPAIESARFIQYLFFGQWRELRAYAAERQVEIIGDIPIFVALDSADVWAEPGIFQLDKQDQPKAVAGVPPDYFSPLGQLWGNPLFDWKMLEADGYDWWMRRLAANFALFDIVRLDHFRGFESYWAVPAKAADARTGKWMPGPGMPFFEAVKKAFPDARLIAEDLGDITSAVRELREDTALPGMSILQFAFGDGSSNLYLPHNTEPNCVVYPGTHDNDTTLGWYRAADGKTRDYFRRYLGVDGSTPQWDLIRASYASVARMAVIPMQDLLNLGSEARMNTPGEAAGNWQWRYSTEQLDNLWRESAAYLRELGDIYHRL